jgi:hypothetical protein
MRQRHSFFETGDTPRRIFPMYRPTQDDSSTLTNYQSAHLAAKDLLGLREERLTDRDSRRDMHRDRSIRGSYYVFRQGLLQVRAFDGQAIGW